MSAACRERDRNCGRGGAGAGAAADGAADDARSQRYDLACALCVESHEWAAEAWAWLCGVVCWVSALRVWELYGQMLYVGGERCGGA